MYKTNKGVIKTIMLFVMIMTLCVLPQANLEAAQPISVYLDGNPVKFSVEPQNIGGKVMVPLRAVFEAMGATLQWNQSTKTAVATKGDITVTVTVGKAVAMVNDKQVKLDAPPAVINGNTLAPLRFVAEAFGNEVAWDPKAQAARITSGGVAPAKTSTQVSFTGDWHLKKAAEEVTEVGWSEAAPYTRSCLNQHLTQTGNQLSGTFWCDKPDNSLIVTGTVNGLVATGAFWHPKYPNDPGKFEMVMAADGKSFDFFVIDKSKDKIDSAVPGVYKYSGTPNLFKKH